MARLTIRSDGGRHHATLDGDDVTHTIRRLNVDLQHGWLPHVVIEPHLVELNVDTDHATVNVPADTADMLVKLGWTPPPRVGRNPPDKAST